MNEQTVLVHLMTLSPVSTEALYKLVDESRDSLSNLAWAKTATLESTRKYIESKTYSYSRDTVLGIYVEQELVGVIEYRDKDVNGIPVWELGYWLGSKHRGKGIMKAAAKRVVKEISKSRTVVAHIRFRNTASFKTLQYAGLHYTILKCGMANSGCT